MPPDDIELAERRENGHSNGFQNGYHDAEQAYNGNSHKQDYEPVNGTAAEDSDHSGDDDDDEALLGSPRNTRASYSGETPTLWHQIKGIVLEVSIAYSDRIKHLTV
jgi:hypothetical protein